MRDLPPWVVYDKSVDCEFDPERCHNVVLDDNGHHFCVSCEWRVEWFSGTAWYLRDPAGLMVQGWHRVGPYLIREDPAWLCDAW